MLQFKKKDRCCFYVLTFKLFWFLNHYWNKFTYGATQQSHGSQSAAMLMIDCFSDSLSRNDKHLLLQHENVLLVEATALQLLILVWLLKSSVIFQNQIDLLYNMLEPDGICSKVQKSKIQKKFNLQWSNKYKKISWLSNLLTNIFDDQFQLIALQNVMQTPL